MIMPGSELEGNRLTDHEAYKASKQDADAKFKDNMSDVDPRFMDEAMKGHNTDGSVKQSANGNERSDVEEDMGSKGGQ
jgi:hypothetical protein